MKKTDKIKFKTDWDLSQLYKSEKDPQIEKDMLDMEKAFDSFALKYKDRTDYQEKADTLFEAISNYESIFKDRALSRPYLYFYYRKDINSKDSEAERRLNLLTERYAKNDNKVLFFNLKISKIKEEKREEFLRSEKLAPYRYFLKCAFDSGKHMLSELEEKILSLKSNPSYSLWIQGLEKQESKLTVEWKKKILPISEAIGIAPDLSMKERHALYDKVMEKLKTISDFAESEINAVIINKKIDDELRGFTKPYSATILGYQNKEKTVLDLVNIVTKNFRISQKFYKLKAKILKLPSLLYIDRSAPIGKTKKEIPFEEAVKIVRNAFEKVNPIYSETLDSFLQNGQIDVYPKAGKQGGAYCSSSPNSPTFVLLNHTPKFRSVMTLAHEMGHAIHAKLSSENQPTLYKDHTISTAEVASTLFENLVFDEVFSLLTPEEQIVALHNKISDDMATIFRQIACFNFEVDLHTNIRLKGSLQKEEMSKLMNKHMSSYLGPVVKMRESDGYFFVTWSHIRRFFYVYSYAFGGLVSRALYASYKKDKTFEKSIRTFLSAGGSKSPEEIFLDAGIDVTKPEFFELGLRSIEEDIIRLEKMTKKSKK
ncbi:MAG: M3 family oligoendopeptidase [Candidatus Taylorbacteria bacterium]|nr:M3 family oligoendopeptidase [Candidatus Taylorbacteria bacterium]